MAVVLITACGAAAESGPVPVHSDSDRGGGQTPAATADATPAPAAAASTPEAAMAGSKTGSGDAATPIPASTTGPTDAVPISSQTFEAADVMAQALSSPELLSCLTSKMGMSDLLQLANRAPTDEEIGLLLPCLTDGLGAGGQAADTGSNSVTATATATPAPAPRTILAQALASPGLMWCLAGHVGMGTLIELDSRAPTSGERSDINDCLGDTREIAAWNAEWPKRIDAAFTPSACGTAPVNNFPSSYYQGPLIDSHLHIPQLSDDGLGGPDDGYVAPRGADSDLYDTISQEQRPILGQTMNIDRIACTLQNEGSIKAFSFFPVFPEITSPAIEVANRAVEQYPDLFVPFIQASRSGIATLEGEILDVMIGVEPGLFAGFGEVGDSPTEPINPEPDSEIYTGDFQVVENHGNMLVYFHPGEGHQDNLERAIQRFPDVTFFIHADFVRPHVKGIMDRNPNVYYTYNDIFGDLIETFRFGEKATFLSDMRSEWDRLLDEADALYREMIEAHPGRFMWGTDRGDIVWGYDEEVGQILAEFGRAFIGRFDPAIQEDLAYKNAERLIALTN